MWTFFQNVLPLHFLTRCAGFLAHYPRLPGLSFLIRQFIRFYQVNMHEAQQENPDDYDTFNEFFSRSLKENARPLGNSNLILPSDGKISQFGKINQNDLIQAKGFSYSLDSLLADHHWAEQFKNGEYLTIYLSPKDYHRVHMPLDGQLKKMMHIHGTLYSVNQKTVENIPDIFSKNERLICYFQNEKTPFLMVLVGATIVGSIFTQWHGVVAPPRTGYVRNWDYQNQNIVLNKGDEMGGFLMGSTVILIFPQNKIQFSPNIQLNQNCKMGENLADFISIK